MARQTLFALLISYLWVGLAAAQTLPNFADIVAERSPAVVKINTLAQAQTDSNPIPDTEDIPEIFRYFFDPRNQPERRSQSMGSGFLVSSDGYLLTNNHVVDGATEVSVRLQDRREYTAELVGSDPRSDLALLKIDGEDLPYLRFADSDSVRVGEWVLAIGSPFGLDFTASVGIVSAIGRSIPTENRDNYVPFIQTDVAINPGNSGGPLFNLNGEVVGVNSQIYTRSGGSIGLSFAIPASVAENVVEQLKTKGRVDRGWLGVMIQEVDRELAESFGLSKPGGALVAEVVPGSPAEKAGVRNGDIITAFDGKQISVSGDLPHVVGGTAPGSKVPMKVVRAGKNKTLTVNVETLGDVGRATVEPNNGAQAPDDGRLGLSVEPLTEELAERFDLDNGVLVVEVRSNSPASRTGLRPGDVITQIGYAQVEDIEQFAEVVEELPSDSLLPIRFVRQGRPVFRTIATPK
jgi:serine protease Do